MNFNIKDFTGPLDLLLHMVKKHEYNIYEVDLKQIIDEYIEFIKSLDSNDLDNKSEYLIMASELIHLKSKNLLGLDDEEDDSNFEINSEEELRNRLIEFEKYQNITNDLRELEKNRQDYFTKLPENIRAYVDDENKLNGSIDITKLVNAMLEISERYEFKKPKTTRITKKEYSIKDKIQYINRLLEKEKKIEFIDLIENNTKEDIVLTFLSILEMSKDNLIILSQEKNFSKIYIEVNNE
ncbi:MAG: segregation/condensation protein A [bacterium]|nr:segregation/condensation protein A [bacterium]